jgi:hypothetical protein
VIVAKRFGQVKDAALKRLWTAAEDSDARVTIGAKTGLSAEPNEDADGAIDSAWRAGVGAR